MLVQVRTTTAFYAVAEAEFGSDRVTLSYMGRDNKGKQVRKKDTVSRRDIVHMVELR